ncbi:MAG: hypothetical protein QG657_5028 [Acidobacteriota bacterium]|nr:hypothetical protein [Acidobacteriota bacterium]
MVIINENISKVHPTPLRGVPICRTVPGDLCPEHHQALYRHQLVGNFSCMSH